MAQEQVEPSAANQQRPRLPRWVSIVVMGRNPRATLGRVAILVVTCFVVFKFILLHIQVDGISMSPTYADRSTHFLSRIAYLRHEPQRGDVVGISLAGLHIMYLKRIIGLPGETIAFENGRVVVNGEVLDEPYQKTACDWNRPPVKLGLDEYFVVGDNRTMPMELHQFGVAARYRILGKLVL